MTAQDLLYRDLTCLEDWLRAAQGIDLRLPLSSFSPAAPEWQIAVGDALSMIRQLNASARRDRYQRILEPLPDTVNSAYANLFRHRHASFGPLADELRQQPAVVLAVGTRAQMSCSSSP